MLSYFQTDTCDILSFEKMSPLYHLHWLCYVVLSFFDTVVKSKGICNLYAIHTFVFLVVASIMVVPHFPFSREGGK